MGLLQDHLFQINEMVKVNISIELVMYIKDNGKTIINVVDAK
jgi:hypothetical protein